MVSLRLIMAFTQVMLGEHHSQEGGGGRFGDRDHAGCWALHHRPTFGGHVGCGLGSFNGQMSGPNDSQGSRDREMDNRVEASHAQIEHGKEIVLGQNQVGASGALGGFVVGGLQILEQAAQLLQQAFEAVKEG
jgi:hypothetical protein